MAGYIPRWFTCPQADTHRSTNPAQRTVTSLIESNALPLSHPTNPCSHELIINAHSGEVILKVNQIEKYVLDQRKKMHDITRIKLNHSPCVSRITCHVSALRGLAGL